MMTTCLSSIDEFLFTLIQSCKFFTPFCSRPPNICVPRVIRPRGVSTRSEKLFVTFIKEIFHCFTGKSWGTTAHRKEPS